MQQKKPKGFKVKNYHKMSDKELDSKIAEIRTWLFNYPENEKYTTAYFALLVALNAKELREYSVADLTQLCIDFIS